jgi:hypothetical protein
MNFEDNVPEENRMSVEIKTQDEINEAVFMEEILFEYDKVYKKIDEGISVEKKLEYMSEAGYICSFKRQEKQLIQVVAFGDRKSDENSKYYFLRDEKMIPTLLINLINKLEMNDTFRLK